jgi:hypothetical protein
MSDMHRKKTFFGYRNIILCHLGGPHASSAWTDLFLNEIRHVGYLVLTFMMFSHIWHKPAHYIVMFFYIRLR